MNVMRAALVALLIGLAATNAPAADSAALTIADQNRRAFSLAGLPAQYLAVTFVASRCDHACPITNALFAQLQKRIADSRVSLGLVTITLDPVFDTPFVMSKLAGSFAADPRIWRLAGGSAANIRALVRTFHVVAEPNAAGIPDVDSSAVYILDRRRKLVKLLLLSASLPDNVLDAVRDSHNRD